MWWALQGAGARVSKGPEVQEAHNPWGLGQEEDPGGLWAPEHLEEEPPPCSSLLEAAAVGCLDSD